MNQQRDASKRMFLVGAVCLALLFGLAQCNFEVRLHERIGLHFPQGSVLLSVEEPWAPEEEHGIYALLMNEAQCSELIGNKLLSASNKRTVTASAREMFVTQKPSDVSVYGNEFALYEARYSNRTSSQTREMIVSLYVSLKSVNDVFLVIVCISDRDK